MANPNIINATSILGRTVYDTTVSNTLTSLVSNASSSGKIFKINSLIIANIDGTNAADITVTLRNTSATLLSTIANTVSVPADATLVVISKDTSIYLEENMRLYVQASAASDLSATCSYEEIS
jgi:hypothetical protein|tara:strand:+ start:259 stop:627 length:369 start_codon:yes stop_codon:yes gene_type:complete